ncbi:MAG: WD40 repeat domain-containing protein, partial [Acidobacteriota bacterium]
GVGGALARHAEATIDGIGQDRLPIVRELFRNLVTAEGTRAVREWNELLSVFSDSRSESATAVLRSLIDARLLTSDEVREEEREPTRRVEIIHESLLANWPRLVRWQTQDADAIQVREQLRHAAKTWDEHNRTDDMLWTGAAFREFASWRERYPGGLSELEETFASAMTFLATRRRRRRRIAVGAIITALLIGLSVVGVFWMQSVREARRAESANLLSRAQLQLESYPSAALAYATASLGLSDSIEAPRLALEALWKGPTAFVLRDGRSWEIEFTPDGQWLVQAMDEPPYQLTVFGADGRVTPLQDVHDDWVDLVMDSTAGRFATLDWGNNEPWCVWSAPEHRLLAQKSLSGPVVRWGAVVDSTSRRLVVVIRDGEEIRVETLGFDGEYRRLGTLPFTTRRGDDGTFSTIAVLEPASGKRLYVLRDHAVYVFEVGDTTLGPPKRLDHIEATVVNEGITVDPRGRFIAARHQDGSIRIWDLDGETSPKVISEPPGVASLRLTRDGSLLEAVNREDDEITSWVWSLEGPQPRLLRRNDLGKSGGIAGWTLDPVGRRIVSILNPDSKIRLWPLSAPEDTAPVVMQRGQGGGGARRVEVHPDGQWLASSFTHGLTLWPLTRRYPVVIDRYEDWKVPAEFGPRGEWLATSSIDSAGTVRLWQLEGDRLPAARVLGEVGPYAYGLAWFPNGGRLIVGSHSHGANVLNLDGQPPRRLPGDEGHMGVVAISPDGKLAAGASADTGGIRFWNLETMETFVGTELRSGMGTGIAVRFAADHRLLVGSELGLESLDPATGQRETLYEGRVGTDLDVTGDGSLVIFGISGVDSPSGTMSQLSRAVVFDLESRDAMTLDTHGDHITAVALDPAGNFAVTGDVDGVIRVDPLDGSDPHLLLGSPGEIFDVSVDPNGRWIASTAGNELRLWPMPDLSKPPLHTLPREKLIAKLKTLTNLRVVRDPESATGWKLTHDPFPGWETVPTW